MIWATHYFFCAQFSDFFCLWSIFVFYILYFFLLAIAFLLAEYGMGCEVSAYGDIYSFGILVLEMFTGKRPTNEMFKDGLSLHSFVKEALPYSVSQISDPTLFKIEGEGEESFIRGEKIVKCLSLILEIGVHCSSELPRERMDINDVAANLHFIKDTLLGSEIH